MNTFFIRSQWFGLWVNNGQNYVNEWPTLLPLLSLLNIVTFSTARNRPFLLKNRHNVFEYNFNGCSLDCNCMQMICENSIKILFECHLNESFNYVGMNSPNPLLCCNN